MNRYMGIVVSVVIYLFMVSMAFSSRCLADEMTIEDWLEPGESQDWNLGYLEVRCGGLC